MADRLLLDKLAVAELLSVSARTIDNLIASGELRPRRIGRRILFERVVVERFARRDHKTSRVEAKSLQD